MDTLFPYNGSAGHVDRPASVQRADREKVDGITVDRAFVVLSQLLERGEHGATWQELSSVLGLHHGQVSGCLSVLHKAGRVFATKALRGRCHVYVHESFRYSYAPEARYDQPVKTKSATRKDALEKLFAAAALVCQFDGTDRDSLEALRFAVWEVQSL
jgi:hypothetical protein